MWVPHDVIALTLDMSVRVVEGAREASGRVAVYRGPLLLSYDARLNREGPLEAAPIRVTEPTDVSTGTAGGAVVVTFLDSHGGTASLCDYASAGQSTAGMLTPRPDPTGPWQFSRSNGEVIAPRVMLMPDGSVSGYSHDNEASWGFEGNDLTLYARNGAPSTRFTTRSERNGLPVLSGVLLLDRSIRHILSRWRTTSSARPGSSGGAPTTPCSGHHCGCGPTARSTVRRIPTSRAGPWQTADSPSTTRTAHRPPASNRR